MWTFDETACNRLKQFLSVISPTMNETDMASLLRTHWGTLGVITDTDFMGNVHAKKNGSKDIHIALCAHMDTVAIQITKILPNGMLQFRRIGITPHVLLGQKVLIKTSNGIVNGVIGFDPTSQYGQPKGLVDEDLWIDICAHSRQEAELMVSIGDLAVLDNGFTILNNDFLCGTALDNRLGLFILTECVRWFSDKETPLNLHYIATTQEEVGLRGAAVITAQKNYNACFIVDVDYATDTLTPHDNQMGALSLGKGVGLHIKADNNPVLRRIACESAKKQKIDYQLSVGRFPYGGTDASPIQLNGVATLNINIPCRYMHSPIEICHKNDIESAVNLLISTIESIGQRSAHTFIPGID